MDLRVGINGFGRIGRATFRVNDVVNRFEVVAINDINPDARNLAYLLKYDSTYGTFEKTVQGKSDFIHVGDKRIQAFCKPKVSDVPWEDLGVDVVIDSSGVPENILWARDCIRGSVRKVVVTHSPKHVDFTIMLGVNEHEYDAVSHNILSSSICDASALAPVLKVLDDSCGIRRGYVTTMHPFLAYQNLLDGPKQMKAFELGRATMPSLIPKTTSVIEATYRVLPHLIGRLDCFSYRVPTSIVSTADLTIELEKDVTPTEVNDLFRHYTNDRWQQIIGFNDEPLVSIDFLKSPYSVIVDGRWTNVLGDNLVKLVTWYDNEWSYCCRVVDIVSFVVSARTEGLARDESRLGPAGDRALLT